MIAKSSKLLCVFTAFSFLALTLNVRAQDHLPAREMMEEFSRMFEEQNRRMNDLILNFFDRHDHHFDDDRSLHGLQFRSSLGGVSNTEIRRRDDGRFVIFELEGGGVDIDNLDINLRDGMITVSGQVRSEESSESSTNYFQSTSISSFSRSFPLPGEAEADSMRVEQSNDGNIQIKFNKRRI